MSTDRTIFILLVVLLLYAAIGERWNRNNIPDLPHCSYVANYCNDYGEKLGIKYIIKSPDKKEAIKALFEKIKLEGCHSKGIVYWRLILLVSIAVCLLYFIYNHYDGSYVKPTNYMFLGVIVWFSNYWSQNHIDYHYRSHSCRHIIETCDKLEKLISK